MPAPTPPEQFTYVFIPAAASGSMEEMTSAEVTLENDTFIAGLKQWFANRTSSGDVDKEMLKKQMEHHAKQELKLDDETMNKILEHTSCDIFPIQVPSKDTGFHCVSLYCDDKGISKGLEPNERATGLVRACGYHDQTIRGDCFISRIFDDEDAWFRCDFKLADMGSDQAWVVRTKETRARSGGNLASLSSMTANMAPNAQVVTPGMGMEPSDMEVDEEKFKWRQTGEDVEITAPLPDGTVKGDLKVQFAGKACKIFVKGDLFFGGTLGGPVEADECTWTLQKGVDGTAIQITLPKLNDQHWQKCFP